MANSEESRLDSALRRGLKGIEGLQETARLADENIMKYLNQKFHALMLREYRMRYSGDEDEAAIAERTTQALDDEVLDARKLYNLFELHMNNRLDEFWKGLNLKGMSGGSVKPATEPGKGAFAASYSTSAPRTHIAERRFRCVEGCVFEGELAYLAHRDRGHHPVPT